MRSIQETVIDSEDKKGTLGTSKIESVFTVVILALSFPFPFFLLFFPLSPLLPELFPPLRLGFPLSQSCSVV